MREIKFRAWNKEKKIMCYDNEDNSKEYFDGINSTEIGFINYRLSIPKDDSDWYYRSRYEVMQYTGLKDKNGMEIFEGDIIKYSFRDGGDTNTRVLEIFNDGVNFKMREINRDYWLEKVDGVLKLKHGHLTKHRGKTQYLMGISVPEIYSYEVIGNIYENLELLGVSS